MRHLADLDLAKAFIVLKIDKSQQLGSVNLIFFSL